MNLYKSTDLERAILLCIIVGTWLVALNQGSEILAGQFTLTLYLRIILDYATPFTVSSFTGLLRNWSDRKEDGRALREFLE